MFFIKVKKVLSIARVFKSVHHELVLEFCQIIFLHLLMRSVSFLFSLMCCSILRTFLKLYLVLTMFSSPFGRRGKGEDDDVWRVLFHNRFLSSHFSWRVTFFKVKALAVLHNGYCSPGSARKS